MQSVSSKNEDSAFLHVIIIFPDPYFKLTHLLANLVFVEFLCFIFVINSAKISQRV